jgi:glycosyltransferase involved in cell wall biosynthesis
MARMLTGEGHHVIHYGEALSKVECAEHVVVTRKADIEKSYPGHEPLLDGPPLLKLTDPILDIFTKQAIVEIGVRKQPGDILLATFGAWHKPIADAHPGLITIEPGIGYPTGAFADNRIFESYAIMHAYQGQKAAVTASNEYWYDAVIPIAFDPAQYTFEETKGEFLLFMGRLHKGKGLHVAIQMAEATKTPLLVAGYGHVGDIKLTDSKYVTHIGSVSGERKKYFLSRAKAVICASHYLEPFNAVQIEAQMCGTPVISSDWGAFAEYNPNGLTGYRCKSFEQFVWAAQHVHELDTRKIRKWAERFSLENIAPHYTDYFQTVADAYGGKGWYELHPDRKTLRSASFTNDAFF